MTLRARLALGLLAIALLLAVPLAIALLALGTANERAEELRDTEVAASLLLGRARAVAQAYERNENQVLLLDRNVAPDAPDSLLGAAVELGALADSLRLRGLAGLADTIATSARTLLTYGRVEIEAVTDGDRELAVRTSERTTMPTLDFVQRAIDGAEQAVRLNAQARAQRVTDAAGGAYGTAGTLFAIAVVGTAVIAVWLTRTIGGPMADLERGMHAVAGGKFAHRLEIDESRSDEFGRLAASFRSMAEQLAEADKMKAEFVSVASHELKTPINVIMGYLKLLEENLYGEMNDRQLEVIGTLQGQADSLARLAQHLLDVSRFKAGAGRLELRPTGLRAFLGEVERNYGVLAAQREIDFAVTVAPELPDVVSWDTDRIQEVIGNLLTNAFKFTDAGGRVELSAAPIHEAVYLEVRDTGAGIAAAQLPHIFDKFFQADNQAAASAKGSGLGLAIAKEIVEAHAGSIAVESRIGEGTKFSIMLPVSPAQPAPDGAAEPDAAAEPVESVPAAAAG